MNLIRRRKIEQQYIVECVRAILSKDTSCQHMLILDNKGISYITATEEDLKDCHGILGHDGKEVIYLCVIGKKLIEELHREVQKEDNPIKWLHEAVTYLLVKGKRMATQMYQVSVR